MKIINLITPRFFQRQVQGSWSGQWLKGTMVLAAVCTTVFSGLAQNIHYNDSRTIVILPKITQTQRPAVNAVNPDTWRFCSDDNFFFISSSTKGNKVNHDYSAYLQFSLADIPEGAIIDSVDLMIYLTKIKNTTSPFPQNVALYELNSPRGTNTINISDSSSIALSPVSKNDTAQGIHLSPDVTNGANWVSARNGNLYCMLAAEESETYQYYTERSGNASRQPKLVIKYHMPNNQVRKNSWPQFKYDAQHTGMLPWQSNAAATGFKLKDAYSPVSANFIKSDPILSDDNFSFAYQASAPPMYRLRTISQQGSLIAEATTNSGDTIGLVKYGPVADRKGNMYCITQHAANTLSVFSGDKLQGVLKKRLENGAQVTATPVIGFDGSIYLSTNQGIYAYTPQPECKIKWVYAAGANKFGQVALDENEQTVYVYDGAGGNIIALNSIDGLKKWVLPNLATFSTDIPVPSVKNGRLCVTNGLRKGDHFYLVNTENGSIIKTVSGPSGTISQPVIGTDKAFIINNGLLEGHALVNGTRQTNSAPQGINPSSTLAVDGNNNVYILNTEQGKQYLTMLALGSTASPTIRLDDAKGYLLGNRLLLSPQGDVYAGNDNHLYGFSPTGFTVTDNITIPFNNANNFNSEYLYRSGGIINVAGKAIGSKQNVVIHSGTSIGFQPGFSIQAGGTLTCKTGY